MKTTNFFLALHGDFWFDGIWDRPCHDRSKKFTGYLVETVRHFCRRYAGIISIGMISRQTKSHEALTATIIGIIVILWMTFFAGIPEKYAFLRNPLHKNMVIVVGTLTIFLVGLIINCSKEKASGYWDITERNPVSVHTR